MSHIFLTSALATMAASANTGEAFRQLVPTSYEAGHFFAVGTTIGDRSLRLLIDYPHGAARFAGASGCRADKQVGTAASGKTR